jgi:hypothetical protein
MHACHPDKLTKSYNMGSLLPDLTKGSKADLTSAWIVAWHSCSLKCFSGSPCCVSGTFGRGEEGGDWVDGVCVKETTSENTMTCQQKRG